MSERTWRTTLKEEFWRPSEDDRLWVRKRIGWGWNLNLAAVARRRRDRRDRRLAPRRPRVD